MKITVTQEHIDKGIRNNNECCPIALALRALGFINPIVSYACIYPVSGSRRGGRPTPKEADQFIVAFDMGEKVEPFTFEVEGLELPE